MTISQRYAFFLSALSIVLKQRYQIGLIFARDRDVFVVFRELHGRAASSCDDQTVKIKKRISSTTYGTGIHSAQTATVLMFIFNRSWCFNNLWRATCKLLMWAKSKTCKILDMRRNIKPNPRSTRVFCFHIWLLNEKSTKETAGKKLICDVREGICMLLDILKRAINTHFCQLVWILLNGVFLL